ncbi:MAG TPA: serine hydrolase, partial [Bryobacteraceae bacterium]|nr:serine hydrolase [Bryobacteraceae bacterium]
HPDKVRHAETLASAIEATHELRADAMPGTKIGLAWLFETSTGLFWHNGATGGYSSYAVFNPKEDYAVVVLFNTTISANGSFADRLGQHVAERLSGRPAVALHD